MTPRLIPAPRRFWRDRTEGLIILAATAALTLGWLLSNLLNQPLLVGLLRKFTGLPCPLCRGSRALEALALGHPLQALALNPLATIGIAALALWLILRLVFARQIHLQLTPTARRTAWTLTFAAVLINWGYIIHAGG